MRKTTKNKFVMGIVIVIVLIVIYQFLQNLHSHGDRA